MHGLKQVVNLDTKVKRGSRLCMICYSNICLPVIWKAITSKLDICLSNMTFAANFKYVCLCPVNMQPSCGQYCAYVHHVMFPSRFFVCIGVVKERRHWVSFGVDKAKKWFALFDFACHPCTGTMLIFSVYI